MWLARYFPGLHLRDEDLAGMTPEATNAMRTVGDRLLKREADERLEHTKALLKRGI